MQSFILMALISVQWVLFGYSLAFGPDLGGIVGSLRVDRALGGRRGAERRLRGDDPPPGLHGLPAHVRDHHAGAHHRRVRRADEVLRLPPLLAPLGHPDLRPARPLGVGRRRLDPRARRPRLRRGHGRPHLLGRLRARRRARDRQAQGLRPRADAAPQPAVHRDRRRRCSGWAGSASTPAARSARAASRSAPSSRRTRRRPPPRSRGCSPSGGPAGSRPSSGRRRAPSRGWSRSRRPRASSGRCPRS